MAEKSNFQPENYSLGTLFWDMTDPTVRFLADTSEGLISTLGLDGSILYTNAAWSAQLGYSATEALELNLLDVLHPDSHDHCKDLLEDLISGRGTASYEATFTAKDGAPHRLQGTALPAVVDGVVVGVVSLLEMISHDGREVPVLKDLFGSNAALLDLATQAIVETSLDALLIMDHHGRIREFNRTAESMFGHKRVDVLGRLMGDVIVPLSMRESHAKGLKR
ncbi:MAG: PAS domain S-box protein, partial [Gemmatimonadales bacterium]|nr:PAS domain S-box protein [Gemmatimonadales bacterium]